MTVHLSQEIIENLRQTIGQDAAYPYAFGYAWGMLTNKQRQLLLEMTKEMVKARA